jgi:hypothetical protein
VTIFTTVCPRVVCRNIPQFEYDAPDRCANETLLMKLEIVSDVLTIQKSLPGPSRELYLLAVFYNERLPQLSIKLQNV